MAAKQGVTYTHEAATGAIAGPKEVDLLHQVFGQPGFPIRGSMWRIPAYTRTGRPRRASSPSTAARWSSTIRESGEPPPMAR